MIYLYVGKNRIRLLWLSKTLLGQYNISYFKKNHESDLLRGGKVANVDLLASAVKEALTLAGPKEVTEKNVCLILPQNSFSFLRYDIPKDISERAIPPFIRDKARASGFDTDEQRFDYLVTKQGDKSKVLLIGQEKTMFGAFEEAFKLLDLKIAAVLPETLCYFKLFEKTLRAQKRENILYVSYEKEGSSGYLYDSLGLLKRDKYYFTGEIKDALKKSVEKLAKEGVSLNRIVLSGKESENVRQDLFTKHVGVWTNPLKKIILNFYQDYLRIIVVEPKDDFSVLDYDVCLGAFIFEQEEKQFSLSGGGVLGGSSRSWSLPKLSLPASPIGTRDLAIFAISLAVSFSAIYFVPRVAKQLTKEEKVTELKSPEPKKQVEPTPTVTPTPALAREEVQIRVLNGTGERGRAGDVKEVLQSAGYTEIVTGNADTFDFAKTEIAVKEGKQEVADTLRRDLDDSVAMDDKQISFDLDPDDAADAVIIVGQDFE